MAGDEAYVAMVGENQRSSLSPGAVRPLFEVSLELDVRAILPTITVPTLVMHREHDSAQPVELMQEAAELIPGARHVELPGFDHWFTAEPQEPMFDAIGSFIETLGGARPTSTRRLATVLFTDIVGSTERAAALGDRAWRELLQGHHARVRRELGRFRGQEVDTAGDGFFATFDGPARAISCAQAIVDSLREVGLEIRAGVHTGECELQDGKVTGIAVNIGARVAGVAGAGEVLVSSTVKDLVAGSDITFGERGLQALKGIPGEWKLYSALPS